MKTFNGLPLYNIEIGDNDGTGIEAVSLVKHPAVEVDFLTFDEDAKPLSFSVDEDEHILTAVALRCDYPIYRRSGDYEYYVIFSKDVIKRLVQKYAKNNLFNSVNINHNSFSFVKDVYMIESFIIDREKGVDYKGFEVKVGSGFTNQDRDYFWANQKELLGRVITVQYFEETTNKKDNSLSLRFPVYLELREPGKEVSYY